MAEIKKTVTITMREDQAEAFSRFLGEHKVAEIPKEAALTVYHVHHGLRAMERQPDLHTLDITEVDL